MLIGSTNVSTVDAVLLVVGASLLYKFFQTTRLRSKTTKLVGPPPTTWIFGVSKEVFQGDSGALFEKWSDEHGQVFQVPTAMGGRRTVLLDPKAIAHFFSKETYTYISTDFTKKLIARLVGKGILWADGDNHRRQRKTLSPAFSNAAIRSHTPVFYDSGYKVKSAWDSLIHASSSDEAIIDVQKWMNRVSLDSVGIAGFGHNFGALEGNHSDVAEVFDSFGSLPPPGITLIFSLLAPIFPFLANIPTARTNLTKKLHSSMEEISKVLLMRSRKDKEVDESTVSNRSIIGSLLKAENADSELRLTEEEVLAQMKVLILAGYETTSISLTWALIELALNPEKQDKLRAELTASGFVGGDPSYDQLTNGLPYLDAVVREILRLHPPVNQIIRIASSDDVVPLGTPLTTASGEKVDRITLARGSHVTVPIRAANRSESIWGANAKEFLPERWLENESGITSKAREIQGFHHLLTFSDGPRTCLGRAFALTEFKSVLTVLIRNFVFAMRDGPETKVEMVTTLLPRPKVAGEERYAMPLRVRRFEH